VKACNLSKDQRGFLLVGEVVLIVTLLVIGVIVGMTTIRDAVTAEMEDTSEAIGSLDWSYAYQGVTTGGGTAASAGSSFGDAPDANAGDEAELVFQDLDDSENVEYLGSGIGWLTLGILPHSVGASSSSNLGVAAGSTQAAVQ